MEENEIEEFKPGATMYVLLFIFYSIWILQAFGAVNFHLTFGFEDFKEYGLTMWLFLPLFCFGGGYSLYAVIKTLRGDKDCIASLKWALMYSFLYTFLNSSRAQIPTYNLVVLLSVFLARPLFYLGFYLWLCFSKGIKCRYPKSERRFAPSGWVWVGVTFCLVGILAYGAYEIYREDLYCERILPSNVSLRDGEITDGYVAFRSRLNWVMSTENLDTIYTDFEEVVCVQTMETTDSTCSVIMFSGRSEKRDARTHNQILTKLLSGANKDLIEKGFCDTTSNGKRLVATIFHTKPGLGDKTFTVATVFDTESPKCVVFASKIKGDENKEWLTEIFNSLRWNLQGLAETENKEDSSDSKNDISYRTGKYDEQANQNMLSCFLKGRAPGFLFSIVLLQSNKREITYSQGYHPFY